LHPRTKGIATSRARTTPQHCGQTHAHLKAHLGAGGCSTRPDCKALLSLSRVFSDLCIKQVLICMHTTPHHTILRMLGHAVMECPCTPHHTPHCACWMQCSHGCPHRRMGHNWLASKSFADGCTDEQHTRPRGKAQEGSVATAACTTPRPRSVSTSRQLNSLAHAGCWC
jgi:hypothetical protein